MERKPTRGVAFAYFLAAELKGAIVANGHTFAQIGRALGKPSSSMALWLNGKRLLTPDLLANMCEAAGLDPAVIVDRAYTRLIATHGEYQGTEKLSEPLDTLPPAYELAAQTPHASDADQPPSQED